MALPRRRRPQSDSGAPATTAGDGAGWHAHYEIENPAEVRAYVHEHPSLTAILAEAPTRVAAAFDEAPRLVIRHEVDADVDLPNDGLVIDILTHLNARTAHERLTRLDESWWLSVLPQIARDGASLVFLPRFL
jgi:hypothetical protein